MGSSICTETVDLPSGTSSGYSSTASEQYSGQNSKPRTNSEGTTRWYNEASQLHRRDGPAVEWADGTKRWYKNGQLHREDGPAIECINGYKEWCKNGQRHRKDGPAVERANGTNYWYLNGKRHRKDGPAIERADGTKEWYLHNQRHRVNGPAIEYANGGSKYWYLNGELCREEVPIIEWSSKTKRWYFPEVIKIRYTEIELEFLPEIFEDTQTLSFQDGGTVYDLNGWLHLEGTFKGHELKSLLEVIAPCIKTPVQFTLTKPDAQAEQEFILKDRGLYNQSGHEITLDLSNEPAIASTNTNDQGRRAASCEGRPWR